MRALMGLMPEPVAKMSIVSKSFGGTFSSGKPLPITGLTITCSLPAFLSTNMPPEVANRVSYTVHRFNVLQRLLKVAFDR
jgi:hypothetical protein